jgi:hypothetical protein
MRRPAVADARATGSFLPPHLARAAGHFAPGLRMSGSLPPGGKLAEHDLVECAPVGLGVEDLIRDLHLPGLRTLHVVDGHCRHRR